MRRDAHVGVGACVPYPPLRRGGACLEAACGDSTDASVPAKKAGRRDRSVVMDSMGKNFSEGPDVARAHFMTSWVSRRKRTARV